MSDAYPITAPNPAPSHHTLGVLRASQHSAELLLTHVYANSRRELQIAFVIELLNTAIELLETVQPKGRHIGRSRLTATAARLIEQFAKLPMAQQREGIEVVISLLRAYRFV